MRISYHIQVQEIQGSDWEAKVRPSLKESGFAVLG